MTLNVNRRSLLTAGAAAMVAPGIWTTPLPAAAQSGGQPTIVDITRARTEPIPIAIPDMAGSPLGAQISRVITNNLRNSGLFRPVDRQAFIQTTESAAATPRFQDWRVIGAVALVTGRVDGTGDRLRVEFRLWDILPEQQALGTAYNATGSNWRQIAHIISDDIYKRMLGETGYFNTRIAYIAETGPRDRRVRRLAIMDQDGENNRFLTDGQFQALTPRFHPDATRIAFMSYQRNEPRVYLFNLESGRQEVLGNFRMVWNIFRDEIGSLSGETLEGRDHRTGSMLQIRHKMHLSRGQ